MTLMKPSRTRRIIFDLAKTFDEPFTANDVQKKYLESKRGRVPSNRAIADALYRGGFRSAGWAYVRYIGGFSRVRLWEPGGE